MISKNQKTINAREKIKLIIIDFVSNKNGKVLNIDEYQGNTTKLIFECKLGHNWENCWANIRRGGWCKNCDESRKVFFERVRKKSKAQIISFVENKGGKILDIENFINNETKLLCECQLGHEWRISGANLKNGKWCNICSKNKKLDLEYCQNIAKEREAVLLSTEYKNSGTKLQWKCKFGHEFDMNVNAINSRGHWCPYCSIWSSEEICRLYFEQIFNDKFPKIRPDWLRNDTGFRLELDGYCHTKIDNYHIAFEHQGEQHYKTVRKNDSQEKLLDLQKRDDIKRLQCIKNNVLLIEIPHLFKILKVDDLANFIKNQCTSFIDISKFDFEKEINFKTLYSNNIYYDQVKEIIETKGGKLLSKDYFNSQYKLDLYCDKEHLFKMSSHDIKSGVWCSICQNNCKLTIEEMQKLAIENNGLCLSVDYINANSKLQWYCNVCRRTWTTTPSSIKNSKTWCPICNGGIKKEQI